MAYFPGLISENSKLASFPLICDIMTLDANFRNLSGKPSPDSKIAQAITPVLLSIFWIFTLTEGHSVWANPLNGSHTKLKASQKITCENFREIPVVSHCWVFWEESVKSGLFNILPYFLQT